MTRTSNRRKETGRGGNGLSRPWLTVAFVALLLLMATAVSTVAQYPDCGFNCRAGDVSVVEAYVDVPEVCVSGETISAPVYVTFDNGTNSDRYAVRVIGDLYVGGSFEQSLDSCIVDTMPPGSDTFLLTDVSWTCGESLELRIVTVSWSANLETCGDSPTCAERKTKCWFAPVVAVGGLPPVGDFFTSSPVCDGETVQFTSTVSGGDTPYNYNWDFGDGGTSSSANPSHLYAGSGAYTVTLTVTEGGGAMSSVSYPVDVNSSPEATASNGGPYCPGDTIELFAEGGTSYEWMGPGGFASSEQNPTIPDGEVGIYTVTVDNVYGCTAQASTLVEIDASPPILTLPTDTTVECGDSIDPVQTGQATATDDTDPSPTVSYADVENLSGCGGTGTITRTWTATDACGNEASGIQTITVEDNMEPTFTGPADITIYYDDTCDYDASTTNTGDVTDEADNCGVGEATFSSDSVTAGTCPQERVITRTWSLVDDCGNAAADQVQTITIVDTTNPVFDTFPANIPDVECTESTDPAATGTPTGSDTCGTVTITYTDMSVAGCGNTETITRTWKVEDECSNFITQDQIIAVVDTVPPVLTVSSARFECNGSGNTADITAWLASAVGTDVCNSVTVTNNYLGLTGICAGTGSADVTFTATDGCGNVAERTATLTVADTTPPTAAGDSASTDEDVSVPIGVLANDDDLCDASPGIVSVGTPTSGTVATADQQINYTPPAGFNGTDTFSYTIADCSGNTASALVEVTVAPVNDSPVANDEVATAQEDTPLPLSVTASDPDGDLLTYAILTGPSQGTISGFDPANGQLTYTPGSDYNGPDSFTFEACDPSGLCDTGVVTITVDPIDDPPGADPQTLTTAEDTPLPITVTGSDADGDPITFGIVSGPSNGTISGFDPATGNLTYTPNADYYGPDSFVFEVCDPDPEHGCAQATVTITVTPVNDAPVASDQARATSEDTETGFFALAITDPDNTLAELECDCVEPPQHGSVERGPNHTVNYTPDPDYTGTDTFTYIVCDPDDLCDTATVTVTVSGANDNPIISASDQTTPENTPITFPVVHSDPDDDSLSCTASDPTHGSVSPVSGIISAPYPATEMLTYTPDPGFSGVDQIVITCDDGQGGTDSVTVEITVTSVNDPPVANDEVATAQEDTPLPLTVTATDPDGDLLTYAILTGPSDGTITGFDPAAGQLTYTPDPDYNGPDSFTFEACDPSGLCDTGVVTITVEPIDDPPAAGPQTLATPEDTALPITVTGSDADGDPITFGIVSGPSNGTISGFDPATGNLTYTPDENYTGADSFVFETCDPHAWHGCAQATVTITVTPINDPPLAQDQTRTTSEDTATGFFALLISDPDNTLAELTCDCLVPPSNGTVVRGPNHTVNYEPNSDFNGIDTFTYVVCDPDGLCDTATVTVNVTPIDDPPVAGNDTASVAEDGSVTINVPGNDSDPDGDLDLTTVMVISQPTNGTVSVDPVTGAITYEPDPDFNGQDTFSYEICDSEGVCDTAMVTVDVLAGNDPPLADCFEAGVVNGVVTPIQLRGLDPDGEPVTYRIVEGPTHGTIGGFNELDGSFFYVSLECSVEMVTIYVGEDQRPGFLNTLPGEAVSISVAGGDPALTTIVIPPENGTAEVNRLAGSVVYVPNDGFTGADELAYVGCSAEEAGFVGPDSIVYEVIDSSGATDQCVVQLFVIAAAGGGGVGECEQRVVISEVAWSGTHASPDHEWIELRNLQEESVDLTGWTLRWRRKLAEMEEETLWKTIPLSGSIAPYQSDGGVEFRLDEDQPGTWWVFWEPAWRGDFFLLERETDEAVLHVDADLIYEEELPLDRVADLDDRGDVIELVDPTGCIVDTASAGDLERGGWIAGTLWPPATMERTDPFELDLDENWHTNLGLVRAEMDVWGNLIHGTPKHENSPILSDAVAVQGFEATRHPMGEPIELRFDPLPEWPIGERLWHVVVTTPALDEVQMADWTVERADDGDTIVRIASNQLPITLVYVWVRTPSGDLLFAPVELYPY